MNVKQLREKAKKMGLRGYSKLRKADLEALIKKSGSGAVKKGNCDDGKVLNSDTERCVKVGGQVYKKLEKKGYHNINGVMKMSSPPKKSKSPTPKTPSPKSPTPKSILKSPTKSPSPKKQKKRVTLLTTAPLPQKKPKSPSQKSAQSPKSPTPKGNYYQNFLSKLEKKYANTEEPSEAKFKENKIKGDLKLFKKEKKELSELKNMTILQRTENEHMRMLYLTWHLAKLNNSLARSNVSGYSRVNVPDEIYPTMKMYKYYKAHLDLGNNDRSDYLKYKVAVLNNDLVDEGVKGFKRVKVPEAPEESGSWTEKDSYDDSFIDDSSL